MNVGFYGWDNPEHREKLKRFLIEHIEKEDWVDSANFCAFLDFIDKKIEKEK